MTTFSLEMPILINVLVFSALFLFCIGVNQFVRQRSARKGIVQKIKRFGALELGEEVGQPEGVADPKTDSSFVGAFAKIGNVVFPAKTENFSQSARIRFFRAGYRQAHAPAVYWGIKILLTCFLPAVLFMCRFYLLGSITYQATMAIMIVGALLGYYLPDIWLRQKSDKRREKILNALPDALDLLVICVEAGIGIDAALQRVSQEIKFTFPELSDELQFTNLELRAGKARHDALRNLSLRTNLSEINSLVTLLIQTDKFGTSMANALRVYSESYRTERYQKAEELAAKLPVKLLFPLTVFIFPSIFVVLLGPAAISIYKALIVE